MVMLPTYIVKFIILPEQTAPSVTTTERRNTTGTLIFFENFVKVNETGIIVDHYLDGIVSVRDC